MKIKEGVHIPGLQIQMKPVLSFAEKIWQELGRELVITSALDGTHSAGSLHYYGYAVDLRTRYFDKPTVKKVQAELASELGSDYDVVIEGNHMHVEYDPK